MKVMQELMKTLKRNRKMAIIVFFCRFHMKRDVASRIASDARVCSWRSTDGKYAFVRDTPFSAN